MRRISRPPHRGEEAGRSKLVLEKDVYGASTPGIPERLTREGERIRLAGNQICPIRFSTTDRVRDHPGGPDTLSLSIQSVSIPSSLCLEGVLKPPTLADRRLSRLRESGISVVRCPQCGADAAREEVLIHRPGQPSVLRVLLRCQGGSRHEGRGCPVQVHSESPVIPGTWPRPMDPLLRPTAAEIRGEAARRNGSSSRPSPPGADCAPVRLPSPPLVQIQEVKMQTAPLVCACGCGREFHPQRPAQRFASTSCRNRFNSRARREREKVARDGGLPVLPSGNGRPSKLPTLAELASWLLELSPEQETAVQELVRLERDRRVLVAS